MRANYGLGLLTTILIFFMLSIACLLYKQQRKYWRLRAWQKNLELNKHLPTLQKIYQDIDGFALSRQARLNYDVLDYIYGEINFLSFIALLSLAKPNQHTVFYDLGCGVGKAVIASALVFPMQKSVGVEILPELYNSSCQALELLMQFESATTAAGKVHFILGDFLKVNLDEANFVFVNSSTLFDTTWKSLCQRLDDLPHIQTVITTSKPLLSKLFSPERHTTIQMSWGVVPAYIHFRKTISNKAIENIE